MNATVYDVGTEDIEYYPHYGKTSPDSYEFEGFARLFFDDFAYKNNISIKYIALPIKRLYLNFLAKQELDFKYPDSPNWNTNLKAKTGNKIYYSKAIISYVDGVFVHQDNVNLTLNDIKTLGVIRGFTPEPFTKNIEDKKINIIEYSRSDHLLMALKAKRIEAIYINVDVANHQIKVNNLSNLVFKKSLPFTIGTYHLSTLKHPEVIKLINNFIEENDMQICKLKEKVQLSCCTSDE